jgi:UDP-N-acetylglucosamine transferase subunit ALG13
MDNHQVELATQLAGMRHLVRDALALANNLSLPVCECICCCAAYVKPFVSQTPDSHVPSGAEPW